MNDGNANDKGAGGGANGGAGDNKGANGGNPNPNPNPNGGARNTDEAVENLRAESAAYRIESKKEREKREQLEKDLEDAKKATEKAVEDERKKGNESVEKFKTRTINSEVKAKAVGEGLEDVDLLPLIMQNFGSEIKMDDDGNVVGIDEAIAAAKEKKPNWFKPGSNSGSADNKGGKDDKGGDGKGGKGSGSAKNPPPAKDIKEKNVKDMSPEEYKRFRSSQVSKLRTGR